MSDACRLLHQAFSRLHSFRFPFDPMVLPRNGIYILLEDGEVAHETKRIVRVGTHTGENQLPSRLRQHFMLENKDRSIFRKNIGRALLHRDHDPFLAQWELDLTTSAAKTRHAHAIDTQKLRLVEQQVSRYIQDAFSFVVLSINNKQQRLSLESKLISTISRCQQCRPSSHWLGLYSPKQKIRESGLWLVNELYKEPLSLHEAEELARAL